MPSLSKTITNLFNGVGQQPPSIRLDSQLEVQENTLSSLTEGDRKRPPSVHIARIYNAGVVTRMPAYHIADGDPDNPLLLGVLNDGAGIRAWDLNGNPQTIIYDSGALDYASTDNYERDIRFLTVGYKTYVVNTNKVVTETLTTAPGYTNKSALVYVRAGNYKTDYQIRINGNLVAEKYTSASDPYDINPLNIAESLRKMMKVGMSGAYYLDTDNDPVTPPVQVNGSVIGVNIALGGTGYTDGTWIAFTGGGGSGATGYINAPGGVATGVTMLTGGSGYTSPPFVDFSPAGGTGATGAAVLNNVAATLDSNWTVTRSGSVLLITRTDGADFTINTMDGGINNTSAFLVIKGEVQRFSDLPTIAPNGYVVKVRAGTSDDGDYFVKFVCNSPAETFGPGTWVEGHYETKMVYSRSAPWALDASEDPLFYGPNAPGSSNINAESPSFIDQKIQDLVFFKNRLGYITGSNVILSRAGEYNNFYRSTMRTILDTDPIDIGNDSNIASTFKYGIPFNDQMLVFSRDAQYILSGGDILTPATAALTQITAFESDLTTRPLAAAKNSYFGFDRGTYSGVQEYFVERSTSNYDANDITSHCPKYIKGKIRRFAKCAAQDLIAVLTDGDEGAIYIYKYYWNGDEKLQSSWSRFTFDETDPNFRIHWCGFLKSILYLCIQRTDGIYLEKMNFEAGITDSSYEEAA